MGDLAWRFDCDARSNNSRRPDGRFRMDELVVIHAGNVQDPEIIKVYQSAAE
jgi:hypothetical protein